MLVDELVKRFLRDADTGRRPTSPPMCLAPSDKAEFPKVLAIDCNHWISLSRVHYGRSADGAARAALDGIRAAVSAGRLIVPLHFINVIEAAKRVDASSRERLVRFMVEETQNHVFQPFHRINAAEIRAAIASVYLACRVLPVRPFVIGHGAEGLMDAVKSDAQREVETRLEAAGLGRAYAVILASPEWTVAAIIEGMPYDGATHRLREADGVEVMNRARSADRAMSPKERARLELSNQWDDRHGNAVRSILVELGAPADVFRQWLSQAIISPNSGRQFLPFT